LGRLARERVGGIAAATAFLPLNPRISPDGKYLAVEIEDPNHDLYTYDFEREVLSRISNDGISHGPIWSPDACRIAYRTWKAGAMTLAWMPADRSSPAERLVDYTAVAERRFVFHRWAASHLRPG
jgi:Tol biopolymer transport system component